MTLHRDWSNAKKTSKSYFKDALEAKKEKLAKEAKGDAKAKEKAVDKSLGDAGLRNVADLDKYFTFKEDFGPALDKLEEAAAKNDEARKAANAIRGIPDVLGNAKLWAAFKDFCGKTYCPELWAFIDSGYKLEPRKAYDEYVKADAKMQINISGALRQEFDAIADDAAAVKSKGPALLERYRKYLIGSHEQVAQGFSRTPEFLELAGAVDLDGMLTKVRATIKSYRKQIDDCDKTWKGIKPDFCYPLETELTKIEYVVGQIEKAQKR
jgi:hypothetical protein